METSSEWCDDAGDVGVGHRVDGVALELGLSAGLSAVGLSLIAGLSAECKVSSLASHLDVLGWRRFAVRDILGVHRPYRADGGLHDGLAVARRALVDGRRAVVDDRSVVDDLTRRNHVGNRKQ